MNNRPQCASHGEDYRLHCCDCHAVLSAFARSRVVEDAERYQHVRLHSYVEIECDSPRVADWRPEKFDALVDRARAKLAGQPAPEVPDPNAAYARRWAEFERRFNRLGPREADAVCNILGLPVGSRLRATFDEALEP